MRNIDLGILLLTIWSVICAAGESIVIGGTEILIPRPAELHEISEISKEMWKLGERLIPNINRLIAFFVEEADLGRAMNGEIPLLQRYVLVQTYRETEQSSISAAEFRSIADTVESQQQALLDELSSSIEIAASHIEGQLSELLEDDISVGLGRPKYLGTIFNKKRCIQFCDAYEI